MIKTKNSTVFIYMFFISLLNILMIYLVKYDLNSIPITNLNTDSIGNIVPLVIEGIFLLMLFISFFMKSELSVVNRGSLFFLSTLSLMLFLFGYLYFKFDLLVFDDYLFGYPSQKIIVGVSLSIAIFVHIYLLLLLLNLFFNQSYLAYVRSILITISFFVIVFVTVFVFITVQEFKSVGVKPGNNNVGVVLGAAVWNKDQPSPIFKGRIEKANHLYRSKMIFKIQLCGGNAPGEMSEAQAAFNYARKLGVRQLALQIEEETSTTAEQIKYIRNNLSSNTKYNDIFIISDQFHLTRVMEISKYFGVKAIGIQSDYHLNWEKLLYYRLRETIALINFWIFAL